MIDDRAVKDSQLDGVGSKMIEVSIGCWLVFKKNYSRKQLLNAIHIRCTTHSLKNFSLLYLRRRRRRRIHISNLNFGISLWMSLH
jgi:hypothetical protein